MLFLLDEARELAVGIEQVAVLVGAIHRAALERGQQLQRFLGGELAGTEHGDLALQHLVEPPDGKLLPGCPNRTRL